MSVKTQMAPLAPRTHHVTTQRDPSSVCVILGTIPPAWTVKISTNARTTPPAALIRCALTCLERTTALVH